MSGHDSSAGILKIAVLAVGGQGGGVLANWISDLASLGDHAVQMTSVAGVAQRTGATIYYIELAPKSDRAPVFSLTPSPGDVDIVIAAELMEAGRAVVRGFVSEDRTTLIASSHRILAVDEKQAPADGRADSSLVLEEIRAAAHRCLCFDMESIAVSQGSLISASLFGALAKSGATPFAPELFEDVIRRSGRGVDASLAAFTASLQYDDISEANTPDSKPADTPTCSPTGPTQLLARWEELVQRANRLPRPVQPMALAGLRKVVDYQDLDYGNEYLDHIGKFLPAESPGSDTKDYAARLAIQAAKSVANAMCYDDIIRVADLKTRAARRTRIYREQQANSNQPLHVTEYFHPRAQELCGTLPAVLGAWIERNPTAFKWLDKLVNKGRRIRTDGITGFSLLWIASSLKPLRRRLLRHRYETAHLDTLLTHALRAAEHSPETAIELLQCQRLVKGYSDTHERGHSKFRKIFTAATAAADTQTSPGQIRQLRDAALADENGTALDQLLDTLTTTRSKQA